MRVNDVRVCNASGCEVWCVTVAELRRGHSFHPIQPETEWAGARISAWPGDIAGTRRERNEARDENSSMQLAEEACDTGGLGGGAHPRVIERSTRPSAGGPDCMAEISDGRHSAD